MTMTDFELGFLVGLIEGEGTIGPHGGHEGHNHQSPRVLISNNDVDLLEYAQVILTRMGIKSDIVEHSKKANQTRQPYVLTIYGRENGTKIRPVLDELVSQHRKNQRVKFYQRLSEMEEKFRRNNERLDSIVRRLKSGKPLWKIAEEDGLTEMALNSFLYHKRTSVKRILNGRINYPEKRKSSKHNAGEGF